MTEIVIDKPIIEILVRRSIKQKCLTISYNYYIYLGVTDYDIGHTVGLVSYMLKKCLRANRH